MTRDINSPGKRTQLALIDPAAELLGKTRSEFMPDSALSKAAEAMTDRRLFLLNDEQWAAFVAALDAPPQPMLRLERLLKEPSALEKAFNDNAAITAVRQGRMAAAMANHASTRTTQLYDRRRDEMTLDEVEKIGI
jgi:uncharacterized protein (DUF1778 family)